MAGTLTISTLSDGTNSTSATNCIQGSAKAWVKWNGSTGTILGSYNVSSVTRNATGNYTFNFTTAMPDTNYTFNFGLWRNQGAYSASRCGIAQGYNDTTISTTQLQLLTRWVDGGGEGFEDPLYASMSIHR